jgi:hypothetical protein
MGAADKKEARKWSVRCSDGGWVGSKVMYMVSEGRGRE